MNYQHCCPKMVTSRTTLVLLLVGVYLLSSSVLAQARRPNIILFLADDFGYGDLSVYGHPTQEWGAVDEMAAQGLRFTQFYSAIVVCTPSRTSLLTGRLPMRSGMDGDSLVHHTCSNRGLPHSEITLAEVLRDVGYATGIVGKWHQGINAFNHEDGSYLPHAHGFDYVGHILPYSLAWDCDTYKWHRHQPRCATCFLYKNTTIVQQPLTLETLTPTLVQDAKMFLHQNHQRPFFLYVSFPQTHVPMFSMEHFQGKSRRGIYGDQVNEMAWAVSEVMSLVKQLGLEQDTLSIFTSDHGPHVEMCQEGGSPGPFKGSKGNFWEGGIRIPAIAHWPGTISPRMTSRTALTLMDIFPTLTDLAGGQAPKDRILDGRSFVDILKPSNRETHSQDNGGQNNGLKTEDFSSSQYEDEIHKILFFYCMDRNLMAVRYEQYKIHFRISNPDLEGWIPLNCNGTSPIHHYLHSLCLHSVQLERPHIYNIEEDPGEKFLLNYEQYESMMEDVRSLIVEHEKTLGNLPEPQLNDKYCRSRFIPCCNPPYCVCGLGRFV